MCEETNLPPHFLGRGTTRPTAPPGMAVSATSASLLGQAHVKLRGGQC